MLCILIRELNPFTFRKIIVMWGFTTAILSFALWLFCLSFFFLLSIFVSFPWRSALSPLVYVWCLCSKFLLCVYYEVYKKHLMEKNSPFPTGGSSSSFTYKVSILYSFPFTFLMSQVISFYAVILLPSYSNYSYYTYSFSLIFMLSWFTILL